MRLRGEKTGPMRLRENDTRNNASNNVYISMRDTILRKQTVKQNGSRTLHGSRTSIALASFIIAGCAASMGFASVATNIVASDTVSTRFSLASPSQLCIEVLEDWDTTDIDENGIADCAQNLRPNDKLARTIRFANTSSRECFAVAQVAIPGVSNDDKITPLLAFNVESSWKSWGEPVHVTGDNLLIWTFLLQDKLAPQHESAPLFEEMIVQEFPDSLASSINEIQVVGYAISADGYNSAQEAWKGYISSGGLGEEVQWLSSPQIENPGGDDGYELEFF